jgi:DNA repair protein RecO (recombination protein O)
VAVVTTRGILLRSHPYGETSSILRFFTEGLGIVGVMAKGARRSRGTGGGSPETFAGGVLTLYMKETRDLQTLKEFTPTHNRRGLGGSVLRLAAASVLAEVLLRHGGEAAAPELYGALEVGLDRLDGAAETEVVPALLGHGWGLVSHLGYHPILDHCVLCGREPASEEVARFDFGAGGIRCENCARSHAGPRVGPGARAQVTGLLEGREGPVTRPRAHLQLLSDFVTYHLSGGRPLRSFAFLETVLPPDTPSGESHDTATDTVEG